MKRPQRCGSASAIKLPRQKSRRAADAIGYTGMECTFPFLNDVSRQKHHVHGPLVLHPFLCSRHSKSLPKEEAQRSVRQSHDKQSSQRAFYSPIFRDWLSKFYCGGLLWFQQKRETNCRGAAYVSYTRIGLGREHLAIKSCAFCGTCMVLRHRTLPSLRPSVAKMRERRF